MFYIEWLQYVEDNWVYDTANCFLIGCRLRRSTSLPHSRRGLVQPAIYIEPQVADLPGCICVFYHVAEVENPFPSMHSPIYFRMGTRRAPVSRPGWAGSNRELNETTDGDSTMDSTDPKTAKLTIFHSIHFASPDLLIHKI